MSSEKNNNIKNLSITELRKLVEKKNEDVKKLEEKKEKELLILAYKKLEKKEKNLLRKKMVFKVKQREKEFFKFLRKCLKNEIIPKEIPDDFEFALSYFEIRKQEQIDFFHNYLKYEDQGMNGFLVKFPDFIDEDIIIRFLSAEDHGKIYGINYYLGDIFLAEKDLDMTEYEREGYIKMKLGRVIDIIGKCEEFIIETNKIIAFLLIFINIQKVIVRYKKRI